jgi:hypothetical protein
MQSILECKKVEGASKKIGGIEFQVNSPMHKAPKHLINFVYVPTK